MTSPRLSIKRLPHASGLPLPAFQTPASAGLDLSAATFTHDDGSSSHAFLLPPGGRVLAKTGFAVAIPEGHVGLVCPRSGLALKHGIGVLNAPGIIDADYRGEVGVILVNHGADTFALERGMRVAQLVIVPLARVSMTETDELPETTRGAGGFGSTGR